MLTNLFERKGTIAYFIRPRRADSSTGSKNTNDPPGAEFLKPKKEGIAYIKRAKTSLGFEGRNSFFFLRLIEPIRLFARQTESR